jgi:hypothetical protein
MASTLGNISKLMNLGEIQDDDTRREEERLSDNWATANAPDEPDRYIAQLKKHALDIKGGILGTLSVEGVKKFARNVVSDIAGMAGNFHRDPAEGIGSLLNGVLVQPISNVITATTGLDPSHNLRAATPEDRADATMQTYALAVTTGVAEEGNALFDKMAQKGLTPVSQLAEVQSASKLLDIAKQAENASNPSIVGRIGQRAVRGAVVSGAAGAAYGELSNPSDPASAVAMGLLFAPLGAAFEVALPTKVDPNLNPALIKNAAGKLAVLRQIQASTGDNLATAVLRSESLAKSSNLIEGYLRGTLPLNEVSVHRFNGLSSDEADYLHSVTSSLWESNQIADKPFFITRENGENVDALLVHPDLLEKVDAAAWRRSGLVPGEVVDHLGQDHQVLDADETTATLQHPLTERTFTVPHDQVKTSTGIDLFNPSVTESSPLSLKARFISTLKQYSDLTQHPYVQANMEAINGRQTGQPISLVGFRQEAGTPIEGTGTYYGTHPSVAANYARDPSQGPAGVGLLSSLQVHRLNFENPLIGTDHVSAAEELAQDPRVDSDTQHLLNAAVGEARTHANQVGVPRYSIPVDRLLARTARTLGYDGLLLGKYEVADLRDVGSAQEASPESGRDWVDLAYRTWQQGSEGASFEDSVQKWGQSHGIHDSEMGALKTEFAKRMSQESETTQHVSTSIEAPPRPFGTADILAGVGVDEAAGPPAITQSTQSETAPVVDPNTGALQRQAQSYLRRASRQDATRLVHEANATGMYVDDRGAAGVTLRSLEDNEILGRFQTRSAAQEFVSASGKSKTDATDLLGGNGGAAPPDAAVAGGLNGGGQPGKNYLAPPPMPGSWFGGRWIDAVRNWTNLNAPWYTMRSDWFTSVDKAFGTDFYNSVYYPLQKSKLASLAARNPHLEGLSAIQEVLKGVPVEEHPLVGQWIEAMNADEIRDHLLPRPITAQEEQNAQFLHDNNVDIDKIYRYTRSRAALKDELETRTQQSQNDPSAQQSLTADHQTRLARLGATERMRPEDMQAADMFDGVRKSNPAQAQLYPIVRLAEALNQGGGLSREQFAQLHDMSPESTQAGGLLDDWYQNLAHTFGIPDAQRLSGYVNHFRNYGENPYVSESMLGPEMDRAGGDAGDFASKMIRSGEVSDYIDDPIASAFQYLHAGMNALHLNEPLANARSAAVDELNKIGRDFPGSRKSVARVANEYIQNIRGVPSSQETYMQDTYDYLMGSLGIPSNASFRGDVVNGWLSLTRSSLLGFKPELAMRDFTTFASMYYSRFGATRFANVLGQMFAKVDGQPAAVKLAQDGVVPGLSPVDVLSREEMIRLQSNQGLTGRATDFLNKIGDAGLSISGQQNLYSRIHAGVYLETLSLARSSLALLSRDLVDKETAYRQIGLHTYDSPVRDGFDNLVTSGDFSGASDYLARVTSGETAAIHGLSNHPYMWGTPVGRIAGQFGMWSVWARNYMARLGANGDAGQAIGAMSRFAATQTAIFGAEKLLGFNLNKWYTLSGMLPRDLPPTIKLGASLGSLMGLRGQQNQKEAGKSWGDFFGQNGWSHALMGSAFHDYVDATNLNDRGYNPFAVIGRGLGFQVDQTQRSFLDDWTGTNPQTQSR